MNTAAGMLPLQMGDLVNFIMLARANVVHVDGPRSSTATGKSHVLAALAEALPDTVRYEASLQHADIDALTGSIVGPHHGVEVGQARLGVLDFLEQVPVDQTLLFDRSPLSSAVFGRSKVEMLGWMHRIKHGQLRQILVLALEEDAPDAARAEQLAFEVNLDYMLNPVNNGGDLAMHVFIARTRIDGGRMACRIQARHLTTAWNYR